MRIVMNTYVFLRTVRSCAKTCAKEGCTRPELTLISVVAKDGVVTFSSLDGYSAFQTFVKCDIVEEGSGRLPADLVAALRIPKKRQYETDIEIISSGDVVTVTSFHDGTSISRRLYIKQDVPEMNRFFPSDDRDGISIAVNPKLLRKIIGVFDGGENGCIRIDIPCDPASPIVFEQEDEDGIHRALLCPVRIYNSKKLGLRVSGK